jgi:hypothetical protein
VGDERGGIRCIATPTFSRLISTMKNFNPRAATLDESDMENQWNQGLKQRLASSEKRFCGCHQAIIGKSIAHPTMPKGVIKSGWSAPLCRRMEPGGLHSSHSCDSALQSIGDFG